MAERRMYTKKITDSDDFTSLSSSAQALYFHLNQGADDDGFNNQIQMAMIKAHASQDDLKVLLAKNFILRFDSGVIVIKHWRMHNALRKDRYKPTAFQEEFLQLAIKENGSYTLGCRLVANWLPQDRIGKVSIDTYNESIENNTPCARACETPSLEKIREVCKTYGYPDVVGEKFFYYYEGMQWKKNGEPITNWTPMLHLWAIREKECFGANTKASPKYKEREYSDEEYEAMFEDLKNIDL